MNLILIDIQTERIPKGKDLTLGDELAEEIATYDEVMSATFTGDVIEVVIDNYNFEVNADLGIEKSIDKVEPKNLDDWEYVIEDDGTATLTCYKGTDTVVTIPNYINGCWVKTVGTNDKADDYDAGTTSLWGKDICELMSYWDSGGNVYAQFTIKEIIISEGIERIEDYAFKYATALEKVSIPRTVTYIGRESFGLGSPGWNQDAPVTNLLLEVNIHKEVVDMGYAVFAKRTGIVINVERNQDEIPSTWNEGCFYWNYWGDSDDRTVNYGVLMN